ncbi:MAG: hypothetical protein Q8O36_01640, partial [Candidatus Omnitrophota bacterium]|nr:hypothetical protein [Candidatus Omnitrophota bacterium]
DKTGVRKRINPDFDSCLFIVYYLPLTKIEIPDKVNLFLGGVIENKDRPFGINNVEFLRHQQRY